MPDFDGKAWRGQSAAVTVYDDADVEIPLGVLQNVEVSAPEAEVSELRGAGTQQWLDIQATEKGVTVSGEWLTLGLDAWDTLINYDSVNNEIDDSPDMPLFKLEITHNSADGSTKVITVDPAYNDSVPFGGSRDEWVGTDTEFTGNTITDITNTDGAA